METIKNGEKYVMNTYSRYPLCIVRGEGMYLWDDAGKKYLDFVAGIAVNSLGSAHPALSKAISEQAQKLIHCSNLYYNEPQVALAKMLVENTGFDKVFFCNSGAEAVEASLKLCRKNAVKKGLPGRDIITMEHSFHGRTYGAVTATGQEKYQKGLDPLLPGIRHVPYNDFEALASAADENVCAVLMEVMQGEGGIIPADAEYLRKVRALCDEKGIMLVFDEVQTGVGRTGELYAHQYYKVQPDAIASAKGLAGGVPIGALLATKEAASAFSPGDHASTFGGNPLAAAAGCVVLTELIQNGLLEHIREMGAYLSEKLKALAKKKDIIKEVRGIGLMQGIELSCEAAPVIKNCMEKGLLLVGAGANVIRFVPPLIVEKEHIDEMLSVLEAVL